ncbi:PqqD family protein [Caldifermentibacillus hisashii]|uniref:PqqD family protein n=1 Tax=Caldifermentibacillus hisashii TaxID=996558 RepID=UPI0031FCC171
MEATIYKHDINFRVRNIANQKILLGNGEAFQLNETGYLIWESIDGTKDLKTILGIIMDSYESTEEVAKNDLINFINFLLEIKAIKEV